MLGHDRIQALCDSGQRDERHHPGIVLDARAPFQIVGRAFSIRGRRFGKIIDTPGAGSIGPATAWVSGGVQRNRDDVGGVGHMCGPRIGGDEQYEVGQQLTVELFEAGDRVKVTGRSKGRGFQGVVKRYGFAGRPASHGHPMSRTPGSMGPGTDPSRVIKGKKLPGRMGGTRTTIQNLQVVRVDGERNLLFVKGGVPGAPGGQVIVRPAVKAKASIHDSARKLETVNEA